LGNFFWRIFLLRGTKQSALAQLFVFSFNPLKINYSIRRKNNVLFWGRTKSMTEKITEGLASGAK